MPRNRVLRTIVQIITAANTLIEPWLHANSLRVSFDSLTEGEAIIARFFELSLLSEKFF